MRRFVLVIWLLLGWVNLFYAAKLRFEVQNEDALLLPCRIHLFDQNEKPQKIEGLPYWHDHFVCPGSAQLELPTGRYRYEIERGPEHERLNGEVTINDESPTMVRRQLNRIANLRDQGWHSGDMHTHRPLSQVALLGKAED